MDGLWLIVPIALGLSMDCFAVAISGGMGSAGQYPVKALKVAFFFGFFQALMPLAGWFAGNRLSAFIAAYDHWFAFGILVFIGCRMIYEAIRGQEAPRSIEKTSTLLMLSVSTSLDAFAVGLSFALLKQPIISAALVIGLVTFLVSLAGLFIGRRAGELVGRKAEIAGGMILIAIGGKILWTGLS